jgi:phage shock protein PspC (stress-responsive transcriptional regulator)
MAKKIKRLYRCDKDKVISGICAGIGEYFEVDPVIIRLLWVIGTILSMGAGLLAYLIAYLIIPQEPAQLHKNL